MQIKKYFSLLVGFLFFNIAHAQQQYVDMGAKALQINGKNILAVTFSNTKDWHTYWKNPGDAGLEIKLKIFKDDQKTDLRDYPWPAPKRYIEQGNMWAFGYSNKYALFYDLTDEFKNSKLQIIGEWLVCKDICIPGTRTVELNVDNNLNGEINPIISASELETRFNKLPAPTSSKNINIFLTKVENEDKLALYYIIENADFSKIDKKTNILTPYLRPLFDYKHEEVFLDTKTNTIYGRMFLDWDGVYEEPPIALPSDGIFKEPITAKYLLHYPKDDKVKIISHTFNEFTLTGNKELSTQLNSYQKLGEKNTTTVSSKNEKSVLYFILFAFLGGLILNLMPCVLPVISLKLFGLIVHSNESKGQILKHNLAYTAGVLMSFLVLALVVLGLKSSGDQIGWGFQLQSPIFVLIMLLVIFVMALNMLGLFEFVTPGGKTLGNAEIKKGVGADFVNGVLATILSTPCSAPFLGTALTFAFTTSYLNIFLIFISVGLGLSFPFILTGFFPSLIKFLPKPGLWMDKLKKFLGLSLILTAVWLYDVFFAIVDHGFVGIYFNTLLATLFFAFYFRKNISKKLIWNVLVFALPLYFTVKVINFSKSNPASVGSAKSMAGLEWKKWTSAKMQEQPGKYRFMNFTASWCLTCKVNKKVVLSSSDFKDLVKDKNIELIEADWTKRDDHITQFLMKYNVVGVPAYFIQKPNGEIIHLGETISVGKIEKNIK